MKKKFTLNDLAIKSFITEQSMRKMKGGATVEANCTAYPVCAGSTSCATRGGEACTQYDCDDSAGCHSVAGPGCSGTVPCMN
ncbi:MAG: pinensin family lanthipeptide [Cyclobacteriaceae bacterium]